MKTTLSTRGALILPAAFLSLALLMFAGIAPANVHGLFAAAAPNPCIEDSTICFPASLNCPPLSCLTTELCDKDFFAFSENGNDYRYWFCMCDDGNAGNAPDPMIQFWECGIIGKTDENNAPLDRICTPDSSCPLEQICEVEPVADQATVCWSCVCTNVTP